MANFLNPVFRITLPQKKISFFTPLPTVFYILGRRGAEKLLYFALGRPSQILEFTQ
jgi:hypothetical protein